MCIRDSARDAWRVRRFLHLSTTQRTCTPGTRHDDDEIAYFTVRWKTRASFVYRTTLCDFLSSQHPFVFLQICGRQIAPTLIRSITRFGATSSSKCISRSCTALTNWRTVCWTFGTAWSRASLTMQLTDGVSVLERVYGQKADILSNCCKLYNSIVRRTVWQETLFRFIRHDVCNSSQTWTLIFPVMLILVLVLKNSMD